LSSRAEQAFNRCTGSQNNIEFYEHLSQGALEARTTLNFMNIFLRVGNGLKAASMSLGSFTFVLSLSKYNDTSLGTRNHF
jgi:hypothetical protein